MEVARQTIVMGSISGSSVIAGPEHWSFNADCKEKREITILFMTLLHQPALTPTEQLDQLPSVVMETSSLSSVSGYSAHSGPLR